MYPLRYTDSTGKVLTGENAYTIKFASPPPVDAFWSLTIYNAGDKLLVDNPIGRYKVGSDTQGLVTAADGSITIPLPTPPRTGDAAKNWLPTPAGPFYLVLRLYQPRPEVAEGRVSAAGGRAGQIGQRIPRGPQGRPRARCSSSISEGQSWAVEHNLLSTMPDRFCAGAIERVAGSDHCGSPRAVANAQTTTPGRRTSPFCPTRPAVQRRDRPHDGGFEVRLSAAGFSAQGRAERAA